MGASMTFSELFDHLSTWVSDKARRFNICSRVKRGSCGQQNESSSSSVGSSGQYQCQFEGAHAFLTKVVNDPLFDVRELYYGKICLKDINNPILKQVNKDILYIPQFMGGNNNDEGYNEYVEELKEVALLNGICH